MSLKTYRAKRNFKRTAEPRGKASRRVANKSETFRFVVHEHHASHLHFDFRLEIAGVLKSWAVPKGPSLNPQQRRLAVEVEDHPIEYIDFTGHIEEGNYGAGEVYIWDSGEFESLDGDPLSQLVQGKLSLRLQGRQLQGDFRLIKMADRDRQWLLIKVDDQYADRNWQLATVAPIDNDDGAKLAAPKRRVKRAAPQSKEAKLLLTPNDILPSVPGAQVASMPIVIEPMLANLVDEPFSNKEWLYELKWDGVRAVCFIKNGQVRFVSRNEKEMGFRYPELAHLPEFVNAEQVILDGEIVALNKDGLPDFQLLQSRIGLKNEREIERLARQHPVVYYIFDLLYYNGFDLMPASLIHRKALLKEIVSFNDTFRLSDHVLGTGELFFEKAERAGLEGIIAKHQGSAYLQKRSSDWLKIKTLKRHEVVIGGFTQPRGSRHLFGALVVGLYRNGEFHYVGHVGGGFNRELLEQVYQLMQPLCVKTSPFIRPPQTNEPVQWVRPALVCEVKFAEWTADDRMRQPIFLGLRDDKEPALCTFEEIHETRTEVARVTNEVALHGNNHTNHNLLMTAEDLFAKKRLTGDVQVSVDDEQVSLTNLDKIYWPDEGFSKGDLLRYYYKVADNILPYLQDRPLILKRYPNGITESFFFQHDIPKAPPFLRRVSIEAEAGRVIDYALCNNLASLLYTTNLGTIAPHPFNARFDQLDYPDWIVFDLDPLDADFDLVCELALEMKSFFDKLELDCYAKTSGAHGMHIYLPIEPIYHYDQVAELAELIATVIVREQPELATLERSLKKRKKGRIYLDHLQNAPGKSVVAPYAVRPEPGATVSAPLSWAEVARKPALTDFTMQTMPRRLARKGDLFAEVLTNRQNLGEAMERLAQLMEKPKARRARA